MIDLVVGGAFAAGLAAYAWLRHRGQREQVEALMAALQACGLRQVGPASAPPARNVFDLPLFSPPPIVIGQMGSMEVWLSGRVHRSVGSEAYVTTTTILVTGLRVPGGIRLRPETWLTLQEKKRGAREIEVGDPVFDARFFVHGTSDMVRAVLDERLRAEIGRAHV